MQDVEKFFHHISPKIISLTDSLFENTKKITYKDKEYSPNFATEGDFNNEELIKNELKKNFPEDGIVAEETLSETNEINSGRKWIIDPICGSANFKNGVRFFCTNIALAKDGVLIASCVIDHCRREYIWSTGNKIIHIGESVIEHQKRSMGTVIEVDLSALMGVETSIIERHEKMLAHLFRNKKYYLSAFNTSLPFAYTSLGRIDAYANGYSKVWDTAAANFLVLQAGGIVTEMNGRPWTLTSENVLGSVNHNLHKELLEIITS